MNWFPRSAGEPQASSQDEPSQDERLAQLLSELADRVQRGESVELERVCESHPDLADELRFLWGAVVVSAAAGDGRKTPHEEQVEAVLAEDIQMFAAGLGDPSWVVPMARAKASAIDVRAVVDAAAAAGSSER